jgi:hypothetical protein
MSESAWIVVCSRCRGELFSTAKVDDAQQALLRKHLHNRHPRVGISAEDGIGEVLRHFRFVARPPDAA